MSNLKEKFFGIFAGVGGIFIMIALAFLYLMNIVMMVKYGSIMSIWSILWGIAGVFFPPLGIIRGALFLF